jgi:hypothetical protein
VATPTQVRPVQFRTAVFKGKINGDRNQSKPTEANNDRAFRALLLVRLGSLVLEKQHRTGTVGGMPALMVTGSGAPEGLLRDAVTTD